MGDEQLLARLRAGEESAFVDVVDRYHRPMVRLAAAYVPSQSVAEEVVQDTWLGMLRGLDRFEERSSLKTWLFTILVNRARTTSQRTVDPHRFAADGHWIQPPVPCTDEIDDQLAATTTVKFVRAAIDGLPEGQREVVLLRDVEGLSAAEVCQVLGVTDGNQRVLLHPRPRSYSAVTRRQGWDQLMALFRRKTLVCRQAVELVTDYLEGALSGRDRARFESHLAGCPHCSECLAQIRETLATLDAIEPESLEPEMRDELVSLYRRWKTD